MDDGGDFNDIRNHEENEGGRRRQDSSFVNFRNFISEMGMGEIKFRGHPYTWANNRENEGFIQERLDRCFGSANWMLQWQTAQVTHVPRQSSDHMLLLLDTDPQRVKTKARFIFYSRWTKIQGAEELVRDTWKQSVNGSKMFKVQKKLKLCKLNFIKWGKTNKRNAMEQIGLIQKEMEAMQELGGNRDWERWKQLKYHLNKAYKEEEEFWSRKARIQWLKDGDKNTKYFHAVTAKRRKRNRIEVLEDENGNDCRSEEEFSVEIAKYFENLFTTSLPQECEVILEGIPRTITETMNATLTKVVEDQEIK